MCFVCHMLSEPVMGSRVFVFFRGVPQNMSSHSTTLLHNIFILEWKRYRDQSHHHKCLSGFSISMSYSTPSEECQFISFATLSSRARLQIWAEPSWMTSQKLKNKLGGTSYVSAQHHLSVDDRRPMLVLQ